MADMNHTIQRDMQALSQAAETITKASEGLGTALEHLAAITASAAEAKEKREKEEQTRAAEARAAANVEKAAKKSFLNLNRKEQQEELKIQRKRSEQSQKDLEEEIAHLRTTTGLNEEEEKQRKKLITSKKRELAAEKENAAAKKELLNEYKLTTKAIKTVKSEWTKVADTRVGKGFLAINKGLGVILGASGAAAGIISVLNSSNKAFVNIARSAGISVSSGGAMADSFTQSSEALARMGYSMEEMGQTATAAIAAIGSSAAATSDAMEFIGASAKVFGMSIDESAGAFKTLSITMGLGASHAADFANTLKNEATSAGVSASLVYRDMANFAAKTSESFGMTPQQLKNATIRAKQLGTTIDEISGASKNFTTMESSLEMTQKAGLLFGAKMNALELTRLARAGKIEQVQDRVLDAVRKQVDANGEIQITDVAQAELLEKMLGKDWKNILKARHMERRIAREVKGTEEDRNLALQIAMRDTAKWNKMTVSERNKAIKKEKQQITNSKSLNELAESYQGAWDRIKSLFISYIQPSLQSFAMWLTKASENGGVVQRVFESIKNTLEKIGPLLKTMKDNPILSALGIGGSIVGVRAAYKKLMGKGDGSRANPFYVRIAGGIPGLDNNLGNKPEADGPVRTKRSPASRIKRVGRVFYNRARADGASRTKAIGQSIKAMNTAFQRMGGLKTLVQATSRLPAVGTLMKIATVGSLFVAGKTLTGDEATGKEKASTVGGLAGGLAGAAAGAKLGGIIGTFFGPGVGTAIGAGIGGVIGGVGGALGAEVIAEKVFDWWEESGIGESISNTWNKVTSRISKIWKKITDPWIPVINNIKRIWGQIKILFNLFVIEPAKQLWEDFKNKIEKYILEPAEKLWKSFKDLGKKYIFEPAEKLWNSFKDLAQEYVFDPAMKVWNYFKVNFVDPITEVAMRAFGYFSELVDDIADMFDFDISNMFEWGDEQNKGVAEGAADKTAGVSNWLQSIIDSKQGAAEKSAAAAQIPTSVSELDVGGRSAQQLADDYGVDISQGAYGFSADQIRNMDPQKIKDYLQKNGIETLDQMSKTQMGKMFLQAQMGKFNVSKNAKGGKYGGDITPKRTNDMGEKVNGAQLALVGEENKDEVIIPTQRIREGKPINAEVAEELQSIGVPGFMRGRRSMTRGGASNAAAQISLERSALALETSASDIKAQEALMKDAIEHSTEVADAQFNHMQAMWKEEEEREKAKEPFDWSLLEVMGAHLVAAEGVINSNAELLQGWGTVGNWLVDNSRLIGDVGRFLMAKDKKEAAIQIALSALTTKIMESIGGGSDGADAGKLFAANMANGMKPMNAALSSMSSVFDKDRQAREALNAKIQAAKAQEAQLQLQAKQMGYDEMQQAQFAAEHMDETAKEFAKLEIAQAPANIALKEAAGEFATGTLAMIEGGMSLKDAAKQQGIIMLKQYALRKIEHLFSKTEFTWEKAKVLWQKIFQAKEQLIQAKEMAIQTQEGATSLLSSGAQAAGAAGAAGSGAAAAGGTAASGGLAAALAPIIVPLLIVVAVMAALYLIVKHWKSIIKFLKKVATYIGKIFKMMGRMFAKIGIEIWNAIRPIIKPLFDALTFIPRMVIRFFKKMWKAIKKVIPGLAAGGVITKPTQVMVGETNEKEVVVPVERIRKGGEVNPAVMAEMNALVPYLAANNSPNTKTNNSGGSNEALINEIRALRAEIAAVANRPISISMDGKKVADVVGERFNRMANNY